MRRDWSRSCLPSRGCDSGRQEQEVGIGKEKDKSQAEWHILVVLAHGKLRQGDREFKTSLGYTDLSQTKKKRV